MTPGSSWPLFDEREHQALLRVLDAASWGGYPEPNTEARAFAEEFANYTGARHAVCCANGSVALELALLACGLAPGDEVLVPAYSFVATASSVAFCHGVPVPIDVCPDTYCMDPELAERAMTERTRAIVVVHLACNMADMDAFCDLASAHDLLLVEDCAHAHGHRWRGRHAGTLGHAGTFSFQTTKLMTAGEGGIVVTGDDEVAMRLHSLVNCGRKEPGYDAFEGRMLGKNYRMTEWQAAVLRVQLERLDEQTARRENNLAWLERRLADLAGISFTRRDPRNDRRACYQLIVRYDPAACGGRPRSEVLEALRARGVECEGEFYVPLHRDELFPMDPRTNPLAALDYARDYDPAAFPCPVAERAAYEEAIWIPHWLLLGEEADMERLARAFEEALA